VGDVADPFRPGSAAGIVTLSATVVGIRATGSYVNHDPILDFDFVVHREGLPPVPISHKELVPQRFLGRVQLGGSLAVRVDLQHPNELSIAW
jgi:hypothetical protein